MLLLASCTDEVFTPKPRGYARIALPKHAYTQFNNAQFPYAMDVPVYGKVVRDTAYFGDKPENPYWINIEFPELGGKMYFTYKAINNAQVLQKLLQDNYNLSYAHSKKADFIDDAPIHTNNNVHGFISHIGGDAASNYQFYATDSVKHFLRGALYFDAVPNADSLKPVTEFLKQDLIKLVNSIEWKN